MKRNAHSLISNKKGGAGLTFVVIILLGAIAYGAYIFMNKAYINADLAKIRKISNALSFYHGQYGTLPNVKDGGKMTVAGIFNGLRQANLVIPEDFVFDSVNINITFSGCQIEKTTDGKAFWKLVPLMNTSNLCLVHDTNKITDYGTKIDDISDTSYGAIFINSYLICHIESTVDDKNLRSGTGMLVKDGVHNALIESENNFNCTDYSKDRKKTNTTNSSTYAMKVY